jgi:hypothetical protein
MQCIVTVNLYLPLHLIIGKLELRELGNANSFKKFPLFDFVPENITNSQIL